MGVDANAAARFFQEFEGFSDWPAPAGTVKTRAWSRKVASVSWSSQHQGLQAHSQRSSAMVFVCLSQVEGTDQTIGLSTRDGGEELQRHLYNAAKPRGPPVTGASHESWVHRCHSMSWR